MTISTAYDGILNILLLVSIKKTFPKQHFTGRERGEMIFQEGNDITTVLPI